MSNHETTDITIFGRRLRARRLTLGYSQEALGVAIGIDESSSRGRISRYELGINEPAIAISRLLAKALEVPVGYFYCDDDLEAEALLIIHGLGDSHKQQIVETLRGCLPKSD
jgi:transcriptional regulator with XRE-family HTH domain